MATGSLHSFRCTEFHHSPVRRIHGWRASSNQPTSWSWPCGLHPRCPLRRRWKGPKGEAPGTRTDLRPLGQAKHWNQHLGSVEPRCRRDSWTRTSSSTTLGVCVVEEIFWFEVSKRHTVGAGFGHTGFGEILISLT